MAGPKLVLMGFEKQLFIGTVGSTAASEVLDVVNLKVSIAHQYGKTVARSDTGGGASPIETSRVVSRKVSLTFNTLNVPANTNLVTIKAAASAGTPIAMKVVDVASGAVEVDGDFNLSVDKDAPLTSEQDQAFTAEPTRDYGRVPTF